MKNENWKIKVKLISDYGNSVNAITLATVAHNKMVHVLSPYDICPIVFSLPIVGGVLCGVTTDEEFMPYGFFFIWRMTVVVTHSNTM